jgi:hypothetical protein
MQEWDWLVAQDFNICIQTDHQEEERSEILLAVVCPWDSQPSLPDQICLSGHFQRLTVKLQDSWYFKQ